MTLSRSDMVACTHSLTEAERTLSRSVIITLFSYSVDTIFREEKSEGRYFRKYRQNIGDISVRGDISEIFSKNRLWWQKISDISLIFW